MSRPTVPEPGVTVTIEEIRRIAALARLRLEQGEAERMARDMRSILDHMAVLGGAAPAAAPGSGVTETQAGARPGGRHSGAQESPAEPDETKPDPLSLPLSRLAPDWRDGFFVVPRLPGMAGASGEPDGSS